MTGAEFEAANEATGEAARDLTDAELIEIESFKKSADVASGIGLPLPGSPRK